MNEEQRLTIQNAAHILDGKTTFKEFISRQCICKNRTPRSIEVPWAASHLKNGKMLDIGFTFASPDYMRTILDAPIELNAIDIIDPRQVPSRYPPEWLDEVLSVPFHQGDIRTANLAGNSYDVVACISTLEHIGYDKPAQTARGSFERPDSPEKVNLVREPVHAAFLNNVFKALKAGGLLLVSVPMGKGGPILAKDSLGLYSVENEYNAASWQELTSDSRFSVEEQYFFRNTAKGWTKVPSPEDLKDVSGDLNTMGVGLALLALRKI